MAETETIVAYYDATLFDYRIGWHLDRQMAMHYGFWDKSTPNLSAALDNENKTLAERAQVKSADRVLDAGCGVGGSAIFLAKQYGCQVEGISLSRDQVDRAGRNAHRRGVGGKVNFSAQDYSATTFPDEAFDVVWAIESVCHATEKADFLAEAYRLLKPNGRLVVADGFRRSGWPTTEPALQKWLQGWAVDGLDSAEEFTAKAKTCGFEQMSYEDITPLIWPSARRIYGYSFVAYPMDFLMRHLRLRSPNARHSVVAMRYQYLTLKQKLWEYGMWSACKPSSTQPPR